MKKIKLFVCAIASLLSIVSCGESVPQITDLDEVKNIQLNDGIISFDTVENAQGYNVKFTHLEEVVYEDTISETTIDTTSLGLEGSIVFTVNAYYRDIKGEETTYNFDVLTEFGDIVFEAESYLANFGTGKEQSNFRNNPLAHEGAYVGGIDDCGQGVYINYLCPVAGEFEFESHYTTAMPVAKNAVYVNGKYQKTFEYTENTGWGGDTYNAATSTIKINLEKGWNTISIMKQGTEDDNYGNFVELDYFVLKGNKTKYNVDDLLEYGKTPETYILEAEMGSPRKTTDGIAGCKNPAIPGVGENKYSNDYLLGGIEKNFDGVEWHFNSPVKAKYTICPSYAAGEFDGSKKPAISFVVTQEEVTPVRSADLLDKEIKTIKNLPYTGWNNPTLATESVEITLEAGKNFIYCVLLDSVDSGFFQLDYANLTFVSEIVE